LEVSATIQMVQGRHLDELQDLQEKRPQNGLVDPAAVVSVMELVTERFRESKVITTREITDETLIAETIVCQIIDRLHGGGYIHRVERQDGAISLARPPEQISADKLVEIGYSLVDEGGVGRQSAFVQLLRDAQTRLARQATLATMLQQRPQPTPGLDQGQAT
jgi:DNA-binding IscR family transcriptional regulator